ncbi:MAG: RNA-binding protein [Ignavibacteriales bacterium]|nr:RNA-binding protein [Ignavibacteriales bacterium]MBI5727237.1 RNA-binding protein [Ignavibacteriales bacterium]
MSTKLFVGSLPWSVSDDSLKDAFAAYGSVLSAKVVKDRATGRSRGFGFVEMESETDAQKALQGLNEAELGGRKISVSEARPKN